MCAVCGGWARVCCAGSRGVCVLCGPVGCRGAFVLWWGQGRVCVLGGEQGHVRVVYGAGHVSCGCGRVLYGGGPGGATMQYRWLGGSIMGTLLRC